MKAWLITWETINQEHMIDEQVAAVLNPRWRVDKVKEIVELLYVNKAYYPSERLGYANSRKFNPYPAKSEIPEPGYRTRITCGHNPWLEARKVDDLEVVEDSEGNEIFKWTEPGCDEELKKQVLSNLKELGVPWPRKLPEANEG